MNVDRSRLRDSIGSITNLISPILLLIGLGLGFIACMLTGRYVSRLGYFAFEPRLNVFLSPSTLYYPTVSQLRSRILSQIRAEQVLVIVGGNSNFNGAGQSADEVWSRQLQEKLGGKFLVVNVAAPGSNGFDLAGVLFRTIEPVHRKTIQLLNAYCNSHPSVDGFGQGAFSYFFWDAFYKKDSFPEATFPKMTQELSKNERTSRASEEMHLGRWLDGFLYANDLWNFISYKKFSTVWSDRAGFSAREDLSDPEMRQRSATNLQMRIHETPTTIAESIRNTRAHIDDQTRIGKDGALIPNPDQLQDFRKSYSEVLSDEHRKKTIMAILWPNPYFIRLLPADEQKKFPFVIGTAVSELKALGYTAIAVGDQFEDEDYYNSTHFMPSGGKKVAAKLAPIVQDLAQTAGF